VKTKKCKQCKSSVLNEDIAVRTPLFVFCSFECGKDYALVKSRAARLRLDNKAKKEAKDKHTADKERVKTKAKWLQELQVLVNQYVRIRDKNLECASCEKGPTWGGQWQAGHYYSRGHSSSLRFNLSNINKQCSVCNNYLSGNIGQYTPKLIDKIGQDRFNYLTAHKSDIRSYDVEWIKRAIKIARKAVKRIKLRDYGLIN